ncbi:inorganic polyphosphate/ATP-NAD kinase [Candidatus Photodesmus blepharus]|uniref:NAD kinase n=1 Tax=Candidatus Photodesmus blepharonis TaxID=1179155 RepID=A0A084CPE5_9GAMM|nr:NAD(+) kinase [Candidatus Photodesmus blepharus]KEY91674.1 inorganic polyphosphate/ATP-NAD kinase [Candidatus Photodesmus blepharus]
MKKSFKVIAIVGEPRNQQAIQTHKELYPWLTSIGYQVFVDDRLKEILHSIPRKYFANLTELGKKADLAIVVGGDGNMLGAARVLSRFDICVIGVNRGNLGFLTDLDPENFQSALKKVLNGEYFLEERFLLETEIHRHEQIKSHNSALNEAVLHPGQVAHMIEFEVYINNSFAFSQRSDGLIVSTPTGSTAYSLSSGGPILSPNLNAITLIPMFPHTLSSRPLVVDSSYQIKLIVSRDNHGLQEVSCDGQISLPVSPGDEILIYQNPNVLKLLHPKDYNYYHILRNKLGWSNKLF